MPWNEYIQVKTTKKPHYCEITGDIIPEGSSCWKYIGHYEGDFQSWYLNNEAMDFINKHVFHSGFECMEIGDMMRREKEEQRYNQLYT